MAESISNRAALKNTLLNSAMVRARAGAEERRRSEPAGVAHLLALRPSIADLEAFLDYQMYQGSDPVQAFVSLDARAVTERAIEILRETGQTIPELEELWLD